MSLKLKAGFLVVVAAQMVLLLAMIGVKQYTLRTGTTVLLQTVPVDPRSLFQGDYAILRYEISTLPDYMQAPDRNLEAGTTVYVALEEGEEVWESRGAFLSRPTGGGVYIKGVVNERGLLEFGIETYFVPEGTGRAIERARDVEVEAAVDDQGRAVIKRVLVDGQPFNPEAARNFEQPAPAPQERPQPTPPERQQ